jgi:hypothetical protein
MLCPAVIIFKYAIEVTPPITESPKPIKYKNSRIMDLHIPSINRTSHFHSLLLVHVLLTYVQSRKNMT